MPRAPGDVPGPLAFRSLYGPARGIREVVWHEQSSCSIASIGLRRYHQIRAARFGFTRALAALDGRLNQTGWSGQVLWLMTIAGALPLRRNRTAMGIYPACALAQQARYRGRRQRYHRLHRHCLHRRHQRRARQRTGILHQLRCPGVLIGSWDWVFC